MAADVWDVAVVGAGFAGSLAALACVRRGLRVGLLERGAQFGGETRGGNLCATRWWEPLGLPAPEFLKPAVRYERVWLAARTLTRTLSPPQELGVWRRDALDRYLARHLADAGVARLDGFCVEQLSVEEPHGPVYVRSAARSAAASCVILACGAEDPVLIRSGLLGAPLRPRRVAFVAQQELERTNGGLPPATVWGMGCVPGLTDAAGSLVWLDDAVVITVWGIVRPSALADGSLDPVALFRSLKAHPLLHPIGLAQAPVRHWSVRILGGFPPARRRLHGRRVLVIGDAAQPMAAALRPGGGFAWAALTARHAVDTVAQAHSHPTAHRLRRYAERVGGDRPSRLACACFRIGRRLRTAAATFLARFAAGS